MSVNDVIYPIVEEVCPPFLCQLEECIKESLQLNTSKKGLCGKDEEIVFKLGSVTTTDTRRKLGSCTAVKSQEVELVIHITAKQCNDDSSCQTLYVQRNIEEIFSDNACFCCLSSGTFDLVDSDVIFEDKNTRKIVRQLVYTIPYKISSGNPQLRVKCCNCEVEAD